MKYILSHVNNIHNINIIFVRKFRSLAPESWIICFLIEGTKIIPLRMSLKWQEFRICFLFPLTFKLIWLNYKKKKKRGQETLKVLRSFPVQAFPVFLITARIDCTEISTWDTQVLWLVCLALISLYSYRPLHLKAMKHEIGCIYVGLIVLICGLIRPARCSVTFRCLQP